MSRNTDAPTVRAHTIGQTPRPDLMRDLVARLDSVAVEIRGALDGLTAEEIPACPGDGYPLETRLRDGRRVVVDAAWLGPRIQASISDGDSPATVHFVLCAGFFARLRSMGRVIQPCEVAAEHLAQAGIGSIEVVVPFAAQACPALEKWGMAGFSCQAHVLADATTRPTHLATHLANTTAQAIVFDYVGLPDAIFREVAAVAKVPVFDVGRLGLDALVQELEKGGGTE